MLEKKRSLYLDTMKGLLIILVIIGHLSYFDYDSRTLTLIYSFHMHAFLIIGGILSHINKDTKLSTIIYKRIKGTLLPYLIFSILSFLIIPIGNRENLRLATISFLRGIGDPVNSINLPLWFLTFYFVAMLVFEIIEWLSYKIRKLFTDSESYIPVAISNLVLIIPLITIAYLYARVCKLPRLPFNIEISIFCLLFIYIGKLIGVFTKDSINEIKKDKYLTAMLAILSLIALVVCLVYWYLFSMKNGRIDLNARDYKNALLMYIDAFLGFYIFACFSFIISLIPLVNQFFACIGENSLYVLAYHIPSIFYINTFILPLLPQIVSKTLSYNSIISILLYTSFMLLYSLCLALIHKSIHTST